MDKICGIYYIKNKYNKRVYVGSSVDIKSRWRSHRSALKNNTHHCKELQEDWNKHGEYAFEFLIEELIPKAQLEDAELKQIKGQTNPYNTTEQTYNPMRDPNVASRNIESRGDSQKGYKGPGASLPKPAYVDILVLLATTDFNYQAIAELMRTSTDVVSRIARQETHDWLKEECPALYEQMLQRRVKSLITHGTDINWNYGSPRDGGIYTTLVLKHPQRGMLALTKDEWIVQGIPYKYQKRLIKGHIPSFKDWEYVNFEVQRGSQEYEDNS